MIGWLFCRCFFPIFDHSAPGLVSRFQAVATARILTRLSRFVRLVDFLFINAMQSIVKRSTLQLLNICKTSFQVGIWEEEKREKEAALLRQQQLLLQQQQQQSEESNESDAQLARGEFHIQ